jgi:hypothetical protein
MRAAYSLSLFCLPALAACSAREPVEVSMLFVQTATSVECDGRTLTLADVHSTTLGFSDRPERTVWHEPTEAFVDTWGEGENSFASDPPNATLTILESSEVELAVMVLSNPRLDGGRLSYDIQITDGTVPPSGGACSLFIDSYQVFPHRTASAAYDVRDDRVQDRNRDIRQDRVGQLTPRQPGDSVDDRRRDRTDHKAADGRIDDRVDR